MKNDGQGVYKVNRIDRDINKSTLVILSVSWKVQRLVNKKHRQALSLLNLTVGKSFGSAAGLASL